VVVTGGGEAGCGATSTLREAPQLLQKAAPG